MQISTNLVNSSTNLAMYQALFSSYYSRIAQKEGEQMQYNLSEVTKENEMESQANLCFNAVTLTGKVHDFKREENGNTQITLCVNRLSGAADIVPITAPFDPNPAMMTIGEFVTIRGIFTSHNKIVDGRSKLILRVLAQEVSYATQEDINNPNIIELSGYVCKSPIYRTTPFNREIADLLLAVNTPGISQSASSYIPAIAWGKNARFAKTLLIGEKVQINGRIQSREYQKRLEDGNIETRIAYEVSINSLYKEEQ